MPPTEVRVSQLFVLPSTDFEDFEDISEKISQRMSDKRDWKPGPHSILDDMRDGPEPIRHSPKPTQRRIWIIFLIIHNEIQLLSEVKHIRDQIYMRSELPVSSKSPSLTRTGEYE